MVGIVLCIVLYCIVLYGVHVLLNGINNFNIIKVDSHYTCRGKEINLNLAMCVYSSNEVVHIYSYMYMPLSCDNHVTTQT